ncbi:hypothetical protein [Pseudoalteromonas phenolica]|uniref:hypothetical protein n=1 Tax=Pseudoalteromonas phenolica TaxID=161398 RepID=UPI0014869D46|nr:hypothetical protein [Pseudoalteromonas phenolica]
MKDLNAKQIKDVAGGFGALDGDFEYCSTGTIDFKEWVRKQLETGNGQVNI